jgi:hypothetical protein
MTTDGALRKPQQKYCEVCGGSGYEKTWENGDETWQEFDRCVQCQGTGYMKKTRTDDITTNGALRLARQILDGPRIVTRLEIKVLAKALVEVAGMVQRDHDAAKDGISYVRCRCDAWKACQGIQDRTRALLRRLEGEDK